MNLTEEQKQTVAQRLAEGDSIADIQKLINEDFGISMTYMEARFLLDDLNLDLKPEEKPAQQDNAETVNSSTSDSPADLVDEAGLVSDGSVSVEVDRIKRPGAAMSGSVVFSDGMKATWMLDPYGRLALEPTQEGYQPSEDDLQDFQVELQKQLQGPGM